METVLIEELKGTGYGSDLSRLHAYGSVQLFAHRDIRGESLKDRNKVVFTKRRGDVVARGNFPPQYLVTRSRYGVFAWPPGEECMKHSFRHVKSVDGKIQKDSETHMGCPDCRARPIETPVAAPAEPKPDVDRLAQYEARIAELEAKLQSQPQLKPKGDGKAEFKCPDCDAAFVKKGHRSMHIRFKHKKEKNE